MASSGAGRAMESSSGSPAISVVVTTIPTSTSQTAYVDPSGTDAAQHPFSQIKLVGVGGLERQNYCCGHWFPSSKSYHRHLAEKAFSDTSHESKLLDLGMVRCSQCSMWVHSENIVAHLAKSHSNNKQAKTSKVIPVGAIGNISGLSRESLMSGTNIVIKVAGQNASKSFNNDKSKTNASPLSASGTVKLVSTSSSTLYQKLQNINNMSASGADKVIVRKSITSTSPMVNVGPRLVMKSVRQGVVPLARTHKMMQQVAQSNLNAVTGVNGVPLTTSLKGAKVGSSLSAAGNEGTTLKAVVSQSNFHKISGKNVKLVKRGTAEVIKDKSMTTNSHSNQHLPESTKTKERNKVLSADDTSSHKTQQNKKRRKQVLKPSASNASCTDTITPDPPPLHPPSPPFTEGKIKLRKRKTKLLTPNESNHASNPPNHKGQRRKFKEALDSYNPKMAKRQGRGSRGGLNKNKRRPGRPRKTAMSETPDTSETDSIFDGTDKEDLENEPLVMAKQEEENIPTVELDLFTLPSTNEQVSVLLTEPQNPNFKVYASMDAIFVGDSALGDVTNQIGYVTDANNVVYVNPSHFLFPNVEDLENFVPSPIVTMKGNKVGVTPSRKTWTLGNNKGYTPIILKHGGVNGSRDAVSSDNALEKSHEDKGSLIATPSAKPRVEHHNLKTTQSGNTVLVVKERKSPKKKPKPIQTTTSLDAEATVSQSSTVEAGSSSIIVNKKAVHKKKKRQKSPTESSPRKEIQSNNVSMDESGMCLKSGSENTPVKVQGKLSPDVKNSDTGDALQNELPAAMNLIQQCVVKIEELKYPLKLEKSAPPQQSLPPENLSDDKKTKISGTSTLEVLETSSPSNLEVLETSSPSTLEVLENLPPSNLEVLETSPPSNLEVLETSSPSTLEVLETLSPTTLEVLESSSPNKTVEDSRPVVEVPMESAVSQSVSVDTVVDLHEENCKPPSSVENNYTAPSEDIVPDVEESKSSEIVKMTTELLSNSTCVTEEKIVNRTVSCGPPRRMRRRRLRTKSANIVSSITDPMHEFNNGVRGKRVRHVSENSSLHKTEGVEQKKVPIDSQTERVGSGHSPKRKCEKVSDQEKLVEVSNQENLVEVSDQENLVDNIVPKQCSYSPQVSAQVPSTSPERLLVDNSAVTPNVSPSAGKGVKKHKSKHEGKIKSLKVESLLTETSDPVETSALNETSAPNETSTSFETPTSFGTSAPIETSTSIETPPPIDERSELDNKQSSEELSQYEKPLQVRSVRERRPSFKLLESFSVAGQSLKKSPHIKQEQPLSPTEHSIDKLESTPVNENYSVTSIATDLSPSREWLGRGAKLKAQVLIQDQQAGVMDSHIYPPNDSLKSSTEPLSPKLGSQSPPKTPNTVTSKTSSPSSSKAFKSPTTVQNREWQARGAKLKAQVMISDPQSSLVPYIDSEDFSKSVTCPPAKKIKLETSPPFTSDIRSYVKQQKPQVPNEATGRSSSASPLSPQLPYVSRTMKQEKNEKKIPDIRSYFKSVSPVTLVKKNNEWMSPKKLASHRLSTDNSQDLSSIKDLPLVDPSSISEYSFEGFKRLTRQSALRSKALLRLVSLFDVKCWNRLNKFPFPVDQLCEWDDDLLTALADS